MPRRDKGSLGTAGFIVPPLRNFGIRPIEQRLQRHLAAWLHASFFGGSPPLMDPRWPPLLARPRPSEKHGTVRFSKALAIPGSFHQVAEAWRDAVALSSPPCDIAIREPTSSS